MWSARGTECTGKDRNNTKTTTTTLQEWLQLDGGAATLSRGRWEDGKTGRRVMGEKLGFSPQLLPTSYYFVFPHFLTTLIYGFTIKHIRPIELRRTTGELLVDIHKFLFNVLDSTCFGYYVLYLLFKFSFYFI